MTKKLALFMAVCAMTGFSACTENNSNADCEDLSKKCDQNAVFACLDGVWTIETQCEATKVCNATSLSCETVAICTDDSKRCNDNNVEICSNNTWQIETQCEAATLCNATSLSCESVAICSNDGKRCNDNNVEICSNNTWQIETQCEATTLCNAELLTCEAIDTCDEGTARCTNSGQLETCQNNRWIVSDCGTDQICLIGKNACENTVCTEQELVCNDTNNGVLTCRDNAWVETACEAPTALCSMGLCVACLNGEKRCRDNAVEICADNNWTIESKCGGKSCEAATHTCVTVTCEDGWKRCNDKIVEICNAKHEYEPQASIACDDGRYCLENTSAHTTTCVACIENAHCTSDNGATVCHSNNTCVVCQAGVDRKCHESNDSLLTCDSNGAWPSLGTACGTGKRCEAGKKECTAIPAYCSANADCKDPLYTECQKNACVCKTGKTTCIVEDGQAKFAICKASAWGSYTNCNSLTPACNAEQSKCVECSDDVHCAKDFKCDSASNTCLSSLTASTIDWCNSQNIDPKSKIAYGRVLDTRDPKNPATIKALLLCGNPGQAISDYKKIEATHHPSCNGCDKDFEYQASLASLGLNEQLCIWSFSLAGQEAVACQTDGSVISNFSTVPTKSTALTYTFAWDHLIDFEAFTVKSSYTNQETVTVGKLEMTKIGTIAKEGNGSIDSNTLVFADKYDHHLTVTNNTADAYIGILAFDYRGWLNDDFKSGQQVEIFLDDQDSPVHVIKLNGKYETLHTAIIAIEQTAKTFKIQKRLKGSTDTFPRLLIDNVRWTTSK